MSTDSRRDDVSAKPKIVLHIGTMKSGTTYLQHGLLSQLSQLAENGWLYPMQFAPARGAINHERAIYGLVGNHIPWVDSATAQRMAPQWQKLITEISTTNSNVLLSAEAVAVMMEDGIEKLLSALPVRDIEVVLTARDLARVLPSSWQQSVRNGRPYGYEEYFDRIKRAKELPINESVGSNFWRSYQLSDVVLRWQKFIPLANISIVTVPTKLSSDSLWARFVNAVNLPLETSEPIFDDKKAHTSITWPEAEVLTQLNQKWAKQGKPKKAQDQLRRRIVQEGFQHRANRGQAIALTAPWLSLAQQWAAQDVEQLLQIGVRIQGNINELLTPAELAPAQPCTAAEIAEASDVAARFHDRMRLQAITTLFGISRKRS